MRGCPFRRSLRIARCGRGGHGTLWIEQVFFAGAKSKFDQRPGIWSRLRLPSLIRLIALHRRLRGAIPRSRRLALHVILADEGSLYCASAIGVNRLLAMFLCHLLGALFGAGVLALLP